MAIGAAALEIPEGLTPHGRGIDSDSQYLQGEGMSVIIDQGPFANSLTSAVGSPDYEERSEEIAGFPARIVFYRNPEDGTYTVAAHIADLNRLTVVVRASESVPRQAANEVIRSIHRASNNDEGNT